MIFDKNDFATAGELALFGHILLSSAAAGRSCGLS